MNKNTADAAGDIDFIISKKNLTQTCLHDPTAMGCGTDREDKDMYAQFVVEIDGKFGPYSMCNPANGYDTGNFLYVALIRRSLPNFHFTSFSTVVVSTASNPPRRVVVISILK